MLKYGIPVDATNEYIKIRESTAIQSLKRFVMLFWIYSQSSIKYHPTPTMLPGYSILVNMMVFQECWVVQIVRTGSEKIVQRLGQDNMQVVVDPQLLFSRLQLIMIFGNGICILVCRVPIMTLMYLRHPIFLPTSLKVLLFPLIMSFKEKYV